MNLGEAPETSTSNAPQDQSTVASTSGTAQASTGVETMPSHVAPETVVLPSAQPSQPPPYADSPAPETSGFRPSTASPDSAPVSHPSGTTPGTVQPPEAPEAHDPEPGSTFSAPPAGQGDDVQMYDPTSSSNVHPGGASGSMGVGTGDFEMREAIPDYNLGETNQYEPLRLASFTDPAPTDRGFHVTEEDLARLQIADPSATNTREVSFRVLFSSPSSDMLMMVSFYSMPVPLRMKSASSSEPSARLGKSRSSSPAQWTHLQLASTSCFRPAQT